jgi:hypothetical protein
MVELVDETEPFAAQARALLVVDRPGGLAFDFDAALETAFEQADCLQEGRLARAGGAEQADDLAGWTAKSTPRSTSIRTPPCSNERRRSWTASTGGRCGVMSFITQHLDRIGARGGAGREEGEDEAQGDRH